MADTEIREQARPQREDFADAEQWAAALAEHLRVLEYREKMAKRALTSALEMISEKPAAARLHVRRAMRWLVP